MQPHATHPAHLAHPRKRRKWPWIVGILAIATGVGLAYAFGGKPQAAETIAVGRATVVETVSVTGRVAPASDANLAFERSGKVSRVFVKVGDRVTAGTPLVELDTADLKAQLAEADARVATEQANLDELKRGPRPEEVAIKEAELAKAEQDLANDYTAALVTVEDSYTKADDAVRVKTDALFTNDDTENLSLTFNVSDSQTQGDVVTLRREVGAALGAWNIELRAVRASSTPDAITALLAHSQAHLAVVRDYLSRAIDAVNFSIGLSAATADTYRTDIGTGRTNVASVTTNVSTAAQNLAAQALVVTTARSELALTKAGTTTEEISAQEAKLLQAEAAKASAEASLAEAVIKAPFAGLITKQDATVGEIVAANAVVVSLIAERSLQIEAYIPEVDIGKVSTGDTATVTFDAFGPDESFAVRVGKIEPAETVVEGVATYKTTFYFLDQGANAAQTAQERVKSGMTANLEIETARHENVIAVPLRTLQGTDGSWRAFAANADGSTREIPVTIGLRGTDGTVEVLRGLSEGDRILAAAPRD